MNIYKMIMILATAQIACMSSMVVQSATTAIPTTVLPPSATPAEQESGEVYEVTDIPKACATVIAYQSLNVRKEPNEKAQIMAWLKRNDIVVVVDTSNPNWWYIESPILSGYVRAEYLQESECE